jgi:CTP:molybdopterin cytidylyltransferase MocA
MQEEALIKKNCSVIIPAAGNSSRMGKAKFALAFNNRHSFIEEIVAQYQSFGCNKIVVVFNKKGKELFDRKFPHLNKTIISIINPEQDSERFYSLQLGLKHIQNSPFVFIHNVDNPFVKISILDKLFSHRNDAAIIKPTFKQKGGHPVLVSDKITKQIIEKEKTDLILSNFLKLFDTKKIAVNDNSILININTTDEYESLIRDVKNLSSNSG